MSLSEIELVSVSLVRAEEVVALAPQWTPGPANSWIWTSQPVPPHREVVMTIRPGVLAKDCRIHHGALPRMVGRTIVRGDEDWRAGWHSPLTGDVHFEEPVGAPGFGIYPPLVVFVDDGPTYLLGPISERQSRCLWEWKADEEGLLEVTARVIPWGIDGNQATGALNTEAWFFQAFPRGQTLEPAVFEGYNAALQRELGPTASQKNPDPGLTWATWNDGTFRDIDEDRILGVCDFLRTHIPAVRWVQIDDGWAGPAAVPMPEDGSLAMSDFGALYKPEKLDDDPRLPNGLKGLADEIRARGLRPLIWLTPAVADGSDLYREHPEWFLTKARLSWMPEMRFLDFSVAETRAFVEKALDLVFLEWGFEGTKLDFWTMTFEETNVELANGERTAIEWMGWFLDAVRARIPEDGLILHCIGLPFGASFRARWCDHFRYYADSEGSCGVQTMAQEQALWAAVLFGLYRVQQFWIPNGDGFGLFDHIQLPANEHRRWATFMMATGSTTELCGWLHQKTDTEAVERVKIVAENARMGDSVRLPGYDFATDPSTPPSIWVREGSDGNRLIGLTNWTDDPVFLTIPDTGRYCELFSGKFYLGGESVLVGGRDGLALVPVGSES
jgi:Melibiase